MNKRLISKMNKNAEEKIVTRKPLSQMERIAFNKSMERFLGPDIVTKIKQFGR